MPLYSYEFWGVIPLELCVFVENLLVDCIQTLVLLEEDFEGPEHRKCL